MASSKYRATGGPPPLTVGVHVGTSRTWTPQDPTIRETDMTDAKLATERLYDPNTGQLVVGAGQPLPDNHADLITADVALGRTHPLTAEKAAAKSVEQAEAEPAVKPKPRARRH